MMQDDLLRIGESLLVSADWPLSKGMEEYKEVLLGGTCSSGETRISSHFLLGSVLFVSCVLRRLMQFLRIICPFSVLTTYDLGFTSSKTTAFLSQHFASSTLTMSFLENTFNIFVCLSEFVFCLFWRAFCFCLTVALLISVTVYGFPVPSSLCHGCVCMCVSRCLWVCVIEADWLQLRVITWAILDPVTLSPIVRSLQCLPHAGRWIRSVPDSCFRDSRALPFPGLRTLGCPLLPCVTRLCLWRAPP